MCPFKSSFNSQPTAVSLPNADVVANEPRSDLLVKKDSFIYELTEATTTTQVGRAGHVLSAADLSHEVELWPAWAAVGHSPCV